MGELSDKQPNAAALRARLDHPVIDGDGHILEFYPLFLDYLKQVAGTQLVEKFHKRNLVSDRYRWYDMSPVERQAGRIARPPFWTSPQKNTRDRMTATLPALLRERLDEFGIDFTFLYATMGLTMVDEGNEEFRIPLCRAYNTMIADLYREHSDRMAPVAVIPGFTPGEAIDEIDHAVGKLGLKAIMLGGLIRRPLEAAVKISPEAARYAVWIDNLALDSQYDYDPLWRKCLEHKVAVTFHAGTMGRGNRTSTTSYIYNQTGNFAEAGDALCKALVLGGVARRFPALNFAFLEGGAGWACDLFSGLDGRLKKRSRQGLENYNPANLDQTLARQLFERYGGPLLAGQFSRGQERSQNLWPSLALDGVSLEHPETLDEWKASGIRSRDQLIDIFARQFYFGCEADDPTAAWAIGGTGTPRRTPLRAFFSSDIGHWDVVDMREILGEAFELLEHGLLDERQFSRFMFSNPASLHATMNPAFFKGTIVEDAVARELKNFRRSETPADS